MRTSEGCISWYTRSEKAGVLSEENREIIEGVFQFSRRTARQIMVPRTDVAVLSTTKSIAENLEMIRVTLDNTGQSTYVNWVPLYHDMGLILNALQSLYIGALCVVLAPVSFMQRPLSWLRAIHEYRAEVAVSFEILGVQP